MADSSLRPATANGSPLSVPSQGDATLRAQSESITTLILAGDEPSAPSPLSFSERVAQKALIEVGSRPMIAWTIDAARHSSRTGAIAIVGMDTPNVDFGEDITYLAGSGNFAQNLLVGLDWAVSNGGSRAPVLVLSSDTPLITPEALTWFVDACGTRENDLHLAIVRQETLEAIYPRSGRSWLKTCEGNFTSGELALIRPQAMLRNRERLVALAQKRRDAHAIFGALSGSLQMRTFMGKAHLWEVREAAQQLTGLQIGLIEIPFAAPALDVDSAQDLAAVRNEMAQLRMLRAS